MLSYNKNTEIVLKCDVCGSTIIKRNSFKSLKIMFLLGYLKGWRKMRVLGNTLDVCKICRK